MECAEHAAPLRLAISNQRKLKGLMRAWEEETERLSDAGVLPKE